MKTDMNNKKDLGLGTPPGVWDLGQPPLTPTLSQGRENAIGAFVFLKPQAPSLKPHPPRPAAQRGSLMVLVIVVLVLLAILGMSYLQVARLDRIASAQDKSNNIDIVAASVTAKIAQTLKDDVTGIFDGTKKPYDHPAKEVDQWLAASSPSFAATDPTWPHLTSLTDEFLRIRHDAAAPDEYAIDNSSTNYLVKDAGVKISGTDSLETSSISGNSFWALGADADGDGVLDSRWEWAPIQQIGGTAYVMAVRIVDNSSMINVNAATAMTSNGTTGYATGTDTPRGYFPTDIDLSRLTSLANGAWSGELSALLGGTTRQLSGAVPSIFTDRQTAWLDHVSMYGYDTNRYLHRNELDLRYRNGLNSSGVSPRYLTSDMPNLLRSGSGENAWYNVVGGSTTAHMASFFQGGADADAVSGRAFPEIRHLLTTVSGAAVFSPNHNNMHTGTRTLKYDLLTQDVVSPANDPAARVTNITSRLAKVLKEGTSNYLSMTDAEIDQVATEYALAIQNYSDTDSLPTGATINTTTFYGLETLPFIREVYFQVAYEDQNVVTAGDGYYETWVRRDDSQAMVVEIGNPFDRAITLGGANGPFVRVAVIDNSDALVATSATGSLSATLNGGAKALVYSTPTVTFDEAGFGGSLLADLGISGIAGVTEINAGTSALRLWAASGGNITLTTTATYLAMQVSVASGTDTIWGTADDTWVTYDRFSLGATFPASFPVSIDHSAHYQVPVHWHVQASVARDGLNSRYLSNGPKTHLHVRDIPQSSWWPSSAPPGTQPNFAWPDYRTRKTTGLSGTQAWHTVSNPVDALAINPVVPASADVKQIPQYTTHPGPQHPNPGSPTPGSVPQNTLRFPVSAAKTIAMSSPTDTEMDALHIPIANRSFASVAELGWIFMYGFYRDTANLSQGDFPARLDSLNAARRFLSFSSVADSVKLTHASMVFDEFTTLSPRYDGADNDNDDFGNDPTSSTGADNTEAEQYVPGTININTAPLHVLTLAAPLPEAIDDVQALMGKVIEYRDTPANRATITGLAAGNVRTDPGIAGIGELLMVNPAWAASGTTGNQDMMWHGLPPNDGTLPATVDLYPMPGIPDANLNATLPNTIEAQMARFQFLSQAFTTRSDVFTAYIYIRGYSASNFGNGPIEAKRFFVVFDRSGITGSSDNVRILGVFDPN